MAIITSDAGTCVRASKSRIPPSSANMAAFSQERVSRRHSRMIAFRASGSTGTAIRLWKKTFSKQAIDQSLITDI